MSAEAFLGLIEKLVNDDSKESIQILDELIKLTSDEENLKQIPLEMFLNE
jgi:hypothetical protein